MPDGRSISLLRYAAIAVAGLTWSAAPAAPASVSVRTGGLDGSAALSPMADARPALGVSPHAADRMIWTRHGAEIVDGPADHASLVAPHAMVGAGDGDFYLTDLGTNAVRRYDAARGRMETIAGDGTKGFAGDGGPSARARLDWPIALARDRRGIVYVSDFGNQRVRALNPTHRRHTVATVPIAPGAIETIAGNGEATDTPEPPPEGVAALETSMAFPRGVAVDEAGNVFYCDVDNQVVRVIWGSGAKAGTVETYAGSGWPDDTSDLGYPGDHGDGGPARDLILAFPSAVTVGPDGDLYIAEWAFNRELGIETSVVWRIDRRGRTAHRIAGNGLDAFGGDGGPARDAGLGPNLQSLVFDHRGNLYIADGTAIRRVDAQSGVIGTSAGRNEDFIPTFDAADEGRPAVGATIGATTGMAWLDGGLNYADADSGVVRRVDRQGLVRGVIRARTGIKQPYAAAIDGADRLFVTEWVHGRVRRLDPDGSLATVVDIRDEAGSDGSGPALLARSGPGSGVAFDERGDLFFSDVAASRVLRVGARAGPGGRLIRPSSPLREIARLAPPFESIVDHVVAHRGKVWFSEAIGAAVVEIDLASGERRTLAGGDGSLGEPSGLALDADAGKLFVADAVDNQIVTIDVTSGAVAPLVDLPFPPGIAVSVHLALSDGLLFVSNDVSGQVHLVDTAATDPSLQLYAGAEVFPQGTAGDGGAARAASLALPAGVAVDSTGTLLIAERLSARVRVVGTSDLRPGAFPNVIRARSDARVELAIESNPQLDATRLVASSITVAGARTEQARRADVNGDRRDDVIVKVRQSALARGLAPGAREAVIEGRLRSGQTFRDADWVTVLR